MAKPSQVCNHNLIPVVGLELHLFGLIMTKCLIISIKNVCRNQKLYYGWLCQASKIAQNRHIFYLLICHLLISIPWKCIRDSINSSCPQTSFPMLADLTMCIWINKPIINSKGRAIHQHLSLSLSISNMHNMGYYHPQSPIWVIDQSKSIYSTIWVFDHPQTQSINRKIWVIDHSHSQSINSTIWVIVHDQSPIWVIDHPQSQSINCGRCKFPRFCDHERYLV